MRKFISLIFAALLAITASAVTLEDLVGKYELQDAYGSTYYITAASTQTTFGITDGDTEANSKYINDITVTTDGTKLYFINFIGYSFYAEPDLEAMTVTIPVQYITAPSEYSFMQCLYESTMFPAEGESSASFNDGDAKPIVLTITEDGDLTLHHDAADEAEAYWDYIALWGWGSNHEYIRGTFHKTADLVADEATASILGEYTCTVFNGEWNSIWSTWDSTYSVWSQFNIETGEGIADLGVEEGPFTVNISTMGGNQVLVTGLFWGDLEIIGTYDADTKTITFPLQSVWGGYTLCNSSLNDVEVPTTDDVVPATMVFNEDGTISCNYTLTAYTNNPYLIATQVLSEGAVVEYMDFYLQNGYEGNGWGVFTDDTKFQTEDGVTYTFTTPSALINDFKISTEGWGLSYGKGEATPVLNEAFEVTSDNGGNIKLLTTGQTKITFVYNPEGTSTLLVEGEASEEPEVYEFHLMNGYEGNDWGATDDNKLATTDNVTYTFTVANGLTQPFKIATAGWDPEFGLGTAEPVLNNPFEVANHGGNITLLTKGETKITLVYNPNGNSTLLIEGEAGEAEAAVLYLRGDMNGWGATDDWKMSTTDNENYYITGVTIGDNQAWKIADSNWGIYNFGTANKGDIVSYGEATQLYDNGQDFTARGGVEATDYVRFNLKTKEVLITDEEPSGIENVGVEAQQSNVWYNLQGIRVNRNTLTPGLYINNGKKVLVK